MLAEAAKRLNLPVVDVRLSTSMRLMRVVSTVHVFALALLPFAMQQGLPMALIALAMAASWVLVRRHPVLGFGPKALQRISFHADGSVTVHDASGKAHGADLLGSSLNTQPLLLLRFALKAGGVRSRAIAGDELEPELLRRLRVRLGLFKPHAKP